MPRLPLLLAVVALFGCATQEPAQNAAELRKSHGYVVAAVPLVVDGQVVTVTLRSLASGKEVQLAPSAGQTLSRWVPEGSYEIAEMAGRERGTLVPIQVTAGAAVDLGGLTWASVGGSERVLLPLRHAELTERTTVATESVRQHLGGEPKAWKPSSTPKAQPVPLPSSNLGIVGALLDVATQRANQAPLRARLKEAANISEFTEIYVASAAPLIGEPAVTPQGTLYIGSNFGRLRVRDSRGAWSAIDTGTLSPLTAVLVNDQSMLVGTADGRLRSTGDGGRTWTALHRFDSSEYVFSIHAHGGRYLILTGSLVPDGPVLHKLESISVYEMAPSPGARPVQLRSFKATGQLTLSSASGLYASIAGQRYLVNRITSIELLELASGTWRSIQAPHAVSHLRVSKDGNLLTAFKAQGAFSKLSVSADGGDSWVPLDTPPYPVIDIHMESLTSGRASRWDMGAFASSLQLLTYSEASKTWTKVWTSPPASCVRTIQIAELEALCLSNGGSVFRIAPEGLKPELVAN